MLAMADQHGNVHASVGGLSHQSRKSLPETEDALRVLESPDPDSSRKDHEGRRIVRMEGGWHLLNHGFYRELGMSEDQKAYWRKNKRLQRQAKSRSVQDVQDIERQSGTAASVSDIASDSSTGESRGEKIFGLWQVTPEEALAVLYSANPAWILPPLTAIPPKILHNLERMANTWPWEKFKDLCGKLRNKSEGARPLKPENLADPDRFNDWLGMAEPSLTRPESASEIKLRIEEIDNQIRALPKFPGSIEDYYSHETNSTTAQQRFNDDRRKWFTENPDLVAMKEELEKNRKLLKKRLAGAN